MLDRWGFTPQVNRETAAQVVIACPPYTLGLAGLVRDLHSVARGGAMQRLGMAVLISASGAFVRPDWAKR